MQTHSKKGGVDVGELMKERYDRMATWYKNFDHAD